MRKIQLTELGEEEECLTLRDDPSAGREARGEEVKVRIKACALSELDWEIRRGKYKEWVTLPCTPGYEIAGIIEQKGEMVPPHLQLGDEVVAFLPFDNPSSGGLSLYSLSPYYLFVKKGKEVGWEEAAGSVKGGIRALTALQYSARLAKGESILILNAADHDQFLLLQFSLLFHFIVFATASSPDDLTFLSSSSLPIHRIIDTTKENLIEVINEETEGMGVDCIVEPSSQRFSFPSTYDLVRALASSGTLVTSREHLQIDPPASKILYYKAAKIAYLFEQNWVLSATQSGRFLHIMEEIMQRLERQEIKVNVLKSYPLEKIVEAYSLLNHFPFGKVIITP